MNIMDEEDIPDDFDPWEHINRALLVKSRGETMTEDEQDNATGAALLICGASMVNRGVDPETVGELFDRLKEVDLSYDGDKDTYGIKLIFEDGTDETHDVEAHADVW